MATTACTGTTTQYSPPPITYDFSQFTTTTQKPVTTTTFPDGLIPVIEPGTPDLPIVPDPPPGSATTTSTSVVVEPPLPPPPTCTTLLEVVEGQLGVPAIPGGEEFDEANGHPYVRCYGTIMPTSDAPAGFRSALFEITAYRPGQIPPTLVDDQFVFAADPTLGPDVEATNDPNLFQLIKEISYAVRTARFPCGGFTCRLHVEETRLLPPDPDVSVINGHIAAIAAGLRGNADIGQAEPPSTTTTLPAPTRPTCDGLDGPVDALLTTFKLTPVGKVLDQFPDNETMDYVGCFGSFFLFPPSGSVPNPSRRVVAYQVWAFEPGREPAYLGFEAADIPAPTIGVGVTSNGGSLTVTRASKPPVPDQGITKLHNSQLDFNYYILGGGGEAYDLRETDARRTIRFSCGAFNCYMILAETAYAPPDPDLTLLDAQLEIYVAGVRQYMESLQ